MPESINFPKDNESEYFLPLTDSEVQRLLEQGRMVTSQLGSLIPPEIARGSHDVLDIACGPGEWVLDVAAAYPGMEVTGIDISAKMIAYARLQQQTKHLSNSQFHLMDAHHLSSLPDASFDFVNARLIQGFMRASDWPLLIQECKRIVRPGGWLRLTESEAPFSTSPALETLYELILHMMWKWGLIYSPTGRHGGVFPLLPSLLAGWQEYHEQWTGINISANQPAHASAYKDHEIGTQEIKTFLIREQVRPAEEIEQLATQALEDFRSEQFRGMWLFLSVWGQRS